MNAADLSRLRREYDGADELEICADPLAFFGRWFEEAAAEEPEPNAMVLATVDESGRPGQRTVLLKGFDSNGFVFFTNYSSDKGTAIAKNRRVNLLFGWYRLHRQVIVGGTARRVSHQESADYFATRPRGAQLAAWASPQSRPVPHREALRATYDQVEQRFPDEVPLPPNWGGFRVEPSAIEFWQGRANRMHDRVRYYPESPGWAAERLAPLANRLSLSPAPGRVRLPQHSLHVRSFKYGVVR